MLAWGIVNKDVGKVVLLRQAAVHDEQADLDTPDEEYLHLLHHNNNFRAIHSKGDILLVRQVDLADIFDQVGWGISQNSNSDSDDSK